MVAIVAVVGLEGGGVEVGDILKARKHGRRGDLEGWGSTRH